MLDSFSTFAYNKLMKKTKYFCILLLLMIFCSGCGQNRQEYISTTDFKLDTVVNVALYKPQKEELLEKCMELCDRYELIFSRTLPDSELYRLNESKDMDVSEDLLALIRMGIDYGEKTDGLFDITIAPVSALWDFSGENPRVPEPEALNAALSSVDYRNILVDGSHVTLKNNASIDLGALAKGYIADRLKEYLLSEGAESAIINLGGNVLCIGQKPGGSNFQVAIQRPFGERNEMIDTASVNDQTVVSSGIYERGFEEDGVWYHHILNPFTGYPNTTDLTGVTIQTDDSVDGDALSTISMSLGSEKAEAFLEQYPGIRAWLILEDGNMIKVHSGSGSAPTDSCSRKPQPEYISGIDRN